ncbi:MAG: hypothetical protein J7M19_00875 [Planctomycetes bacterium]|nr:hypothetical protein [Planctomycetota bacterium]
MKDDNLDINRLKTYSIRERRSLVDCKDFASLPEPGASVDEFVASLPGILAGKDFKELTSRLRGIAAAGSPIVFAMGAHVIKCGLSPVVIDLMKRGIVTAIALNGACAIHDYEIALIGRTSEDVTEALPEGRFGMARETAVALAQAASTAREKGAGLGRSLGELIIAQDLPQRGYSLFAAAAELGVPATVHVAIGTDVVHMHPEADGADIGAASLEDFRIACGVVAGLSKGAWINIGSAVLLPEVFLKAVSVARNLGADLDGLVTANLDMFDLYRPRTNVVNRPSAKGYQVIGRHEIMLPLLRMALISPTT